jgi:hypothetical protein
MIFRRAFLILFALPIGAFAVFVALNPRIEHNPATAQVIARYAIGIVSLLAAIYLSVVACFSSDEYIEKNVTLDKLLDRL